MIPCQLVIYTFNDCCLIDPEKLGERGKKINLITQRLTRQTRFLSLVWMTKSIHLAHQKINYLLTSFFVAGVQIPPVDAIDLMLLLENLAGPAD